MHADIFLLELMEIVKYSIQRVMTSSNKSLQIEWPKKTKKTNKNDSFLVNKISSLWKLALNLICKHVRI